METISCHSNESTWATTIKIKIYVEANVMNTYEHLSKVPALSPLWLLIRRFLNIFFENLASESAIWTKFIWLVKDYSRNISVKCFSKYLQYHRNKCQFPLFPL